MTKSEISSPWISPDIYQNNSNTYLCDIANDFMRAIPIYVLQPSRFRSYHDDDQGKHNDPLRRVPRRITETVLEIWRQTYG